MKQVTKDFDRKRLPAYLMNPAWGLIFLLITPACVSFDLCRQKPIVRMYVLFYIVSKLTLGYWKNISIYNLPHSNSAKPHFSLYRQKH